MTAGSPDPIISEKDFVETWGAEENVGGLYQWHEVVMLPLNQVWSVVECDNGDWIAMPGFHVVNVVGYVTTKKPWDDITLQAYWINADDMGDDDEREKLIEFLKQDWLNSFADGPQDTFDAAWQTLCQGTIGYDNMPIEQLRQEAIDAGYEAEDEDEPG